MNSSTSLPPNSQAGRCDRVGGGWRQGTSLGVWCPLASQEPPALPPQHCWQVSTVPVFTGRMQWPRAGASPLREHGQLLSLFSGEVVTPQKPLPHLEPRLNNRCTAWDQQLHSLGSGLRTKQPSPVPSSLPFPATRPMSLFHCPHCAVDDQWLRVWEPRWSSFSRCR